MDLLELFWDILRSLWDFALGFNNASTVVGMICGVIGGLSWFGYKLWRRWRSRKLKPEEIEETFPFEIIPPRSRGQVIKAIYGSSQDDKDPLADFNIPYQQRCEDYNVRQRLEQRLEQERWLLILGKSGLGKTRETAELAQILNNEGWTVLKLKNHEMLTAPTRFDPILGTQPKLLFVLDDLNKAMVLGRSPIKLPQQDEKMAQLQLPPLPDRLQQTLQFYETALGTQRVRVIATAKNDPTRVQPDLPSELEKLGMDTYAAFWNRFAQYELEAPEDTSLMEAIRTTATAAKVSTTDTDVEAVAKRCEPNFRNVVENMIRLQNRQQSLSVDTFQDTLTGTWESRYRSAIKKYPTARYLYDAIDLLQQCNVELSSFLGIPIARMLVQEKGWRKCWTQWQIPHVLKALKQTERILQPRDGQIEAKGYRLELQDYANQLLQRLNTLAQKSSQPDPVYLQQTSVELRKLERYEEALFGFEQYLKFMPQSSSAWFYKGLTLNDLDQHEEAIAAYDQALASNPDDDSALNNKGLTLADLGRYEDAIAAYDQCIDIKPDYHAAFNNKGVALGNLERYEDAIAAYDQCIDIKPEYKALNNKGLALADLGRYKDAIAAYNHCLAIKPDYDEALNNKGNALSKLERYEEAIAVYDQLLTIKSDYSSAMYNKACCYGLQQDVEPAMIWLQKAIDLDNDYLEMAKTDTDFDAIRDDPCFQSLLDSVPSSN